MPSPSLRIKIGVSRPSNRAVRPIPKRPDIARPAPSLARGQSHRLYAVRKQVKFVPYVTTSLVFAETRVTDRHWSVRHGANKEK
jgi:hypothetical protein